MKKVTGSGVRYKLGLARGPFITSYASVTLFRVLTALRDSISCVCSVNFMVPALPGLVLAEITVQDYS